MRMKAGELRKFLNRHSIKYVFVVVGGLEVRASKTNLMVQLRKVDAE